jgi:hypothetical protein
MASPPSSSSFSPDAISRRLVAEGRAASTYGLNANLFDMEVEALRAPYAALAAAVREEFAAACGERFAREAIYVYPFEHLHVTAASPAPFTHTTLAAAPAPATAAEAEAAAAEGGGSGGGVCVDERAAFEAAYLAAARDECVPAKGWPAAPFEVLVGAELRLDAACGILLCGDAAGAVPRVRRCLAACMQHPAVAALGEGVARRAAFKHPNIVHMSFLRFVGDPAAAEGGDAAIRAAFARAVARAWPAPVRVLADAAYIVRELRPYMHLRIGPRGGPPGEDAACVAARLPYAAAAAAAAADGEEGVR